MNVEVQVRSLKRRGSNEKRIQKSLSGVWSRRKLLLVATIIVDLYRAGEDILYIRVCTFQNTIWWSYYRVFTQSIGYGLQASKFKVTCSGQEQRMMGIFLWGGEGLICSFLSSLFSSFIHCSISCYIESQPLDLPPQYLLSLDLSLFVSYCEVCSESICYVPNCCFYAQPILITTWVELLTWFWGDITLFFFFFF